jgi:hypothetical protein
VKERESRDDKEQYLTWNSVGGLTLIALIVGIFLGFLFVRQRIFLAPPLAASTVYFYVAVASLPALITFLLALQSRPTGTRVMLAALPIFSCMMIIVYLTLIGPALYTHIQCPAGAGAETSGQLICSCQVESSDGKTVFECLADKLSPLPLIRLVEEK